MKRISMLVAAGLLATACSSGGSSGSSDTLSTTTVAAPVTTSATTSTTTASTTTASTTTVLVTSTTQPPDAAVRAAYEAFVAGYWACVRAPESCDVTALTAPGQAQEALRKTVGDLVGAGLKASSTANVGYTVVERISIDPLSRRATVESCWWDTGVLVGPPASPGGPEVVVNDKQVTARFTTGMVETGGTWKVETDERTERIEARNACSPPG